MEKACLDDWLLEYFLRSDCLRPLNFHRRRETLWWGRQLLTEHLSNGALVVRLHLALEIRIRHSSLSSIELARLSQDTIEGKSSLTSINGAHYSRLGEGAGGLESFASFWHDLLCLQ